MFVPKGKVHKTPLSPASSTLRRSEARRLLDVASEAKISDGSSTYLKSMLEKFSTEFSILNDSDNASHILEESEELEGSQSDESGTRDSNELSLSDVAGDADHEAKRQLLMQILSSNPPRGAATVPGAFSRLVVAPTSTTPAQPEFDSTTRFASTTASSTLAFEPGSTAATSTHFAFMESSDRELRAEIERLAGLLEERRILFRDLVSSSYIISFKIPMVGAAPVVDECTLEPSILYMM